MRIYCLGINLGLTSVIILAGMVSGDCRYRCGSGAEVTEGGQCRTNTSALFLELGENQLIPNTRVLIEMLVFHLIWRKKVSLTIKIGLSFDTGSFRFTLFRRTCLWDVI